MLDYDHEIIYNKDKENVVSDTLSMKYDEEGSIFSLSFLVLDWLKSICLLIYSIFEINKNI